MVATRDVQAASPYVLFYYLHLAVYIFERRSFSVCVALDRCAPSLPHTRMYCLLTSFSLSPPHHHLHTKSQLYWDNEADCKKGAQSIQGILLCTNVTCANHGTCQANTNLDGTVCTCGEPDPSDCGTRYNISDCVRDNSVTPPPPPPPRSAAPHIVSSRDWAILSTVC